jgi:hypothetical protein
VAEFAAVTPEYFRTLEIAQVSGRNFSNSDDVNSQKVALIDDTLAHRYWPGEDPIGKQVKAGALNSAAPWTTIVGVVSSIKSDGFDAPAMPHVYFPLLQNLGVRVALGAQRSDILRMALGEGMLLVAIGLGVGLIGAAIVTRFLRSMLYSVTATDPLTFASIALLLAAVALLACFIPAQRATQVDPLVALRED